MSIFDMLLSNAMMGEGGGGGGSGFTEISVTYANTVERGVAVYGYDEDPDTFFYVLNGIFIIDNALTVYASISTDITNAVFKCMLPTNGYVKFVTGEHVTITGDAEVIFDESYGEYLTVVTGDCSITITG